MMPAITSLPSPLCLSLFHLSLFSVPIGDREIIQVFIIYLTFPRDSYSQLPRGIKPT
jgi:hypothetical protein